MRLVPAPRACDDWLDADVFGRPVERLASERSVGYQFRRIAGAARGDLVRNGVARLAAAGVDHFHDARAGAGAEVELQALAGLQSFERRQMRGREVVDVDVVADAGAVGSRVVVAEDSDLA